jgi:hypothetical protein
LTTSRLHSTTRSRDGGRCFSWSAGRESAKTRLADELGRRASESGFSTYWGRCWEMGGAPVYWPWIQILRELSRDLPREELKVSAVRGGRDGGAAGARAGVRHSAAGRGGRSGASAVSAVRCGHSLLKAASRFASARPGARRPAHVGPIVAGAAPLHRPEPARTAGAGIVGAYRPKKRSSRPRSARRWAMSHERERSCRSLPLDRAQISELVARFSGPRHPNPELVRSIRTNDGRKPAVRRRAAAPPRAARRFRRAGAGGAACSRHGERGHPEAARALAGGGRAICSASRSVVGRDFASATLAALAKSGDAVRHHRSPDAGGGRERRPRDRARLVSLLARAGRRDAVPGSARRASRGALHLEIAGQLEGARRRRCSPRSPTTGWRRFPPATRLAAAAAARRAADRAMGCSAFEDAAAMLEADSAPACRRAERLDPLENFELRLGAGLAFIRAGQGERGRALVRRRRTQNARRNGRRGELRARRPELRRRADAGAERSDADQSADRGAAGPAAGAERNAAPR